jgi:hypothetical protein
MSFRHLEETLRRTASDVPIRPVPLPAEPVSSALATEGSVSIETEVIPIPGQRRDLGDLLDAIEVFVRRFVVINEVQAAAIVLWVAHTWAIDAARSTPYLYVVSAEPESGKTRLLEVLEVLVRAPIPTMNVSDAALFRVLDKDRPTLLFDEVDAVFGKKARDREDLRSMLNSGYRRGGKVLRMGGSNYTKLERFQVFGPKALAGLGDLPGTLASRSLRIELKRRRIDSEPIEDFYPDDLNKETRRLRSELKRWAADQTSMLKAAKPARVDGLRDRTNEVWRPMLAIAELAGEAWSAAARRSALGLAAGADDDDKASLGLLLLRDIRDVFASRIVERIKTSDLIVALATFSESPWGEWWIDPRGELPIRGAPRQLAHRLRPYGVRTNHTVRDGKQTAKGYRREDFVDAWERFLPARVEESHQSHQSQPAPVAMRDVTDVTDVTDRREGPKD